MLTHDQLAKLASYDSATIANAIESFKVRPQVEGYCGLDIKAMMPEYTARVGYAITCTADSTTENYNAPNQLYALYKAIAAAPHPVIVVLKDVSQNRNRSFDILFRRRRHNGWLWALFRFGRLLGSV